MPKKNAVTLALALFAAAAVFGLSFAGARMGTVSRAEAAAIETPTAEDDTKSIAIPGYEAIPLKAGQNEQSVSFYNPARNDCYFVVSLILNGEELFASEPIVLCQLTHRQAYHFLCSKALLLLCPRPTFAQLLPYPAWGVSGCAFKYRRQASRMVVQVLPPPTAEATSFQLRPWRNRSRQNVRTNGFSMPLM